MPSNLERYRSRGHPRLDARIYQGKRLYCTWGGRMSIISFVEEPKTIDRIIHHLELTFEAERPPPPPVVQQEFLMAAVESREYF